MSYASVPASFIEFKKTLKNNGEVICEASRFIVYPSCQSSRVARLLIKSSLSTYILHEDCYYLVINCGISYERFHKRYGIQNIDVEKSYISSCAEIYHCLPKIMVSHELISWETMRKSVVK